MHVMQYPDAVRTTITISEELLELARQRARSRGVTVSRVIEEAVQHELHRSAPERKGPDIPVFTGGAGIRPGIDLTSNRELVAALDDDAPFEKLR